MFMPTGLLWLPKGSAKGKHVRGPRPIAGGGPRPAGGTPGSRSGDARGLLLSRARVAILSREDPMVPMLPQRLLGNTGLTVSVLGYGGAPIGFRPTADRSAYLCLLQRALDLGINFFDTAPDYRGSEELLGEALASHRNEVIFATKCGRVQTWNGLAWDLYEDWSEAGVLQTIERSLRALRTDYLDLVQLHSPPLWVLEDGAALRGLLKAQAAGKVRQIGLSSEGETAWRGLELGVFATLQVSYSIMQQEAGDDLLPAAAEQGLGLIIKQPLANAVPLMSSRPDHPDWSWKWDVCQRMDWAGFDA